MKKIGLFYATKAEKTSWVAKKIHEVFGKEAEAVALEEVSLSSFDGYDRLIIGASTWFDGELPTYWDELLPELESLNLKGKKIALFGLADEVHYPENFADGLGILAELFEQAGATLVGFTSTDGYTYKKSRALRNDQWCGLVVDLDNHSERADKQIAEWCKQVKQEF